MTDKEYFNLALASMHNGQWFGWKKVDSDGNKIPNDQRMTYANIKVVKDGATIPSESDVNTKIQEIKDAETATTNKKASAKTKLKDLGLDDAEINAILGL